MRQSEEEQAFELCLPLALRTCVRHEWADLLQQVHGRRSGNPVPEGLPLRGESLSVWARWEVSGQPDFSHVVQAKVDLVGKIRILPPSGGNFKNFIHKKFS